MKCGCTRALKGPSAILTLLEGQKAYSGFAEGKNGPTKGKVSEPKPRKSGGERRVRHKSRVAKPKRPVVREGKSLDDNLDERAWLDW